jgi:hypothetical protein
MVDMMVIVTFIPFVYIFSVGFRFANRTAALCGLAVTLIAIALSTLPPPDVASGAIFELKILGGCLLVAITGWMVFRHHQLQRSRIASSLDVVLHQRSADEDPTDQ